MKEHPWVRLPLPPRIASRVGWIERVKGNLTRDGRDRSLDYKLSDFFVGKGSHDAKVLDLLSPTGDEIVLPRTSSGVFNATVIDYVLRSIGIDTLVITR